MWHDIEGRLAVGLAGAVELHVDHIDACTLEVGVRDAGDQLAAAGAGPAQGISITEEVFGQIKGGLLDRLGNFRVGEAPVAAFGITARPEQALRGAGLAADPSQLVEVAGRHDQRPTLVIGRCRCPVEGAEVQVG
ncbi:MAG: hypothetical protein EBY66_01330 [Candidatus Fonsibacter lacus]|nr:hypothetical protein [Candidatus Fonsibacter lacus]